MKKRMLRKINIFKKIYNKCYNLFWLRFKHVDYGKKLRIEGRILLQGHGRIEIGNDVTIYSHYAVNPIGGNKTVFQVMDGASLKIGNHVGMSHVVIAVQNSVIIEDDVLLGAECKIFDTDFHSIMYADRMKEPDTQIQTAPVKIKKGAFVGAGCYILKGVTIGQHSVIGAGSVVTKDVPDNEIWGGNPAKKIRSLK